MKAMKAIAVIKQLMNENRVFTPTVFIVYLAGIISAILSNNNTAIIILLTIQLLAALHDLYNRTIPYTLSLSALAAGILMCMVLTGKEDRWNLILGGIAAFIVTKIIAVASKGQLGGGDMALMTLTGLYSGLAMIFNILVFSFIFAALFSILLIVVKKADRKTEIPFAPFILMATVVLVLV